MATRDADVGRIPAIWSPPGSRSKGSNGDTGEVARGPSVSAAPSAIRSGNSASRVSLIASAWNRPFSMRSVRFGGRDRGSRAIDAGGAGRPAARHGTTRQPAVSGVGVPLTRHGHGHAPPLTAASTVGSPRSGQSGTARIGRPGVKFQCGAYAPVRPASGRGRTIPPGGVASCVAVTPVLLMEQNLVRRRTGITVRSSTNHGIISQRAPPVGHTTPCPPYPPRRSIAIRRGVAKHVSLPSRRRLAESMKRSSSYFGRGGWGTAFFRQIRRLEQIRPTVSTLICRRRADPPLDG